MINDAHVVIPDVDYKAKNIVVHAIDAILVRPRSISKSFNFINFNCNETTRTVQLQIDKKIRRILALVTSTKQIFIGIIPI